MRHPREKGNERMHIGVFQAETHIELIGETRSPAQPEAFPLLELTAGTPSIPQAEAFTLLDTLTVFMRETSLRKALIEVMAPSRNLWLLEHIDIWNYAVEKGLIGARIAYVVSARAVDSELIFAERYAGKRGIALKFFAAKSDALPWLLQPRAPHSSGPNFHASAAFDAMRFENIPAGSLAG
jgi:hypothetical protein